MEQVYDIFKSFVDPVFIIFVLLLISFIASWVSNKKKGGALFLLFVLILFYGSSISAVSNYFSYQLEKKYIKAAPAQDGANLDVVVVLSGGAHDIKAANATFSGEATMARLAHAVRVYKHYNAKYLVCSGTGKTKVPDAELMAQMAQDFGVPKERIRIEAKSENTYEHALEFNRMFVDKDMKVGLVTSAFHMKRSEREFKKYFSNVFPMPSHYLFASPSGTAAVRFIPQSQPLANNALILREYVGAFWYRIKDI